MEDTISILRGLKERFEVHHGVRISDSSIVEAVVLSNRYITDRQLPDKAIDLIDEAAAMIVPVSPLQLPMRAFASSDVLPASLSSRRYISNGFGGMRSAPLEL